MSDPHTDRATLSGDWEGYEPGREDAPFGSLPGRVDRVVADMNERLADVLPDGTQFMYEPADGDQAHLLATEVRSATFMVPAALLDDYADMSDLLGKALRGEIELKPAPEPRYHRCLACWLVSLLPGHDRCTHGRLDCDDCREEAR